MDAASILRGRARSDVALGLLTTYRVGGPADLFLEIEGPADLELACRAVAATGVQVLAIGRGSNLLVADAGFRGLAVKLGDSFAAVDVSGTHVRAGGAAALPVLARRTAASGLTGLEWAVGVPGSVGGAVRMNAGGHGSETRDTLRRAGLVDLRSGADTEVAAADLALGYRRSSVTPDQVVLWAEFGLREGDREASETEVAGIVRWRRAHQPGGAHARSVFTNPS